MVQLFMYGTLLIGMMKAICGEKEENGEQGPVKGILSELNYTGTTMYFLRIFVRICVATFIYIFVCTM